VDPEYAWQHVLIAEGSDWFWWFGEHHQTELDHVWDEEFRHHLQQVYRSLGEPVPVRLHLPVTAEGPSARPAWPTGTIHPVIDGVLADEDGWSAAGRLSPDHPSTMHRADGTHLAKACFGWDSGHLYLLIIPGNAGDLPGLELDVQIMAPTGLEEPPLHVTLAEGGRIEVSCEDCGYLAGRAVGAWADVAEIALPLAATAPGTSDRLGLVLRVGREGMMDYLLRSPGLADIGEAGI
jgi:hypothetical protein